MSNDGRRHDGFYKNRILLRINVPRVGLFIELYVLWYSSIVQFYGLLVGWLHRTVQFYGWLVLLNIR